MQPKWQNQCKETKNNNVNLKIKYVPSIIILNKKVITKDYILYNSIDVECLE